MAFAIFAVSMTPATVFPGDRAVMSFVAAHRTGALTAVAVVLNFIGSIYGIGTMLPALTVWLWRKDKQLALTLAFTTVALAVLVEEIKLGVARPRPPDQMFAEINMSFPSSHAALVAYFFGWLAVLSRRHTRPAIQSAAAVGLPLLIVLIGVSRVYVGAHWPSDVLAGFCLGLGTLWVVVGACLAKETGQS